MNTELASIVLSSEKKIRMFVKETESKLLHVFYNSRY
jgi:hypothetical protein